MCHTEITRRINANASKIWGGNPASYELDFETHDYERWYCILKEEFRSEDGKSFHLVDRTMTLGDRTTEQAVKQLDRTLQAMLESRKEQGIKEAKAKAPNWQ